MTQPHPRFADSVVADVRHIRPLRRACADFALEHGLSAEAVEDLEIAVAEALTNVVVHAYRFAQAPGPMAVQVLCVDGEVIVVVGDHGSGFRPRPDSPGGGFGLDLIGKLAASVEVVPNPAAGGRGTQVTMTFRSNRSSA